MRISDWSSDVCSSDLTNGRVKTTLRAGLAQLRISNDPFGFGKTHVERRHRIDIPGRRQQVATAKLSRRGVHAKERCERAAGIHFIGFGRARSEEHTSELQSLMRNSYAVFCLKQKLHYTHSPTQYTQPKAQTN